MKKTLMMVTGSVVVAAVTIVGFNSHKEQTELKSLKYADARLSVLELQEGIEFKIKLLFDDLVEERVAPTEKGLRALIQAITILRVHGKDLSQEAKNDLIKIVQQLESSGFQNEALLKKLDDLARSLQMVSV